MALHNSTQSAITTNVDRNITSYFSHADDLRQTEPDENGQALINILPLELLQAIFFHSLPESGDPDPMEAPLLLCRVCSLWRVAAFGVPRLWNKLSLVLPSNPPDETARENTIHIARIWMKNAKESPISLSLTLSNISDGVHIVDHIVTPHSNRFISLTLLLILTKDLVHFFTLPHSSVDQLERLTLHFYGLPFGDKPMTVFQFAPRLKSVLIKYIDEEWFELDASHIFLPWSQLVCLDIRSSIRYIRLRSLFRKCTLLERCHLCVGYMEAHNYADRQVIAFPSLFELSLDMMYQKMELFGIQDYEFPSLTDLQIIYGYISDAWIQRAAQTLRFEILRRLNLNHSTIAVPSLLTFLRATPNLMDLSFWLDCRNNAETQTDATPLWEALTVTKGDADGSRANILTRLQALDMWIWVQGSSFFPRACLDMVKSRCGRSEDGPDQHGPCLESISMHLHMIDEESKSDIYTYLEPCRASGLKVWVDMESWASKRYLAGES